MHQRAGLATVFLAALALLSACSGSTEVAGKYMSQDNPGDYLELKSDGTFYLEEEGFSLSGSY